MILQDTFFSGNSLIISFLKFIRDLEAFKFKNFKDTYRYVE